MFAEEKKNGDGKAGKNLETENILSERKCLFVEEKKRRKIFGEGKYFFREKEKGRRKRRKILD